jgi:hypothetical protein
MIMAESLSDVVSTLLSHANIPFRVLICHTHTHTHIQMHAYTYKCKHTHIDHGRVDIGCCYYVTFMCKHAYSCAYVPHTHIQMHAYTYKCMHTHTNAYIRILIMAESTSDVVSTLLSHANIPIRVLICHTHTHTHIQMHAYTYKCKHTHIDHGRVDIGCCYYVTFICKKPFCCAWHRCSGLLLAIQQEIICR